MGFLPMIYITLLCDLDLWPMTLNICSVSPVTWWNSVPNLNTTEQFAAEIAISVFDLNFLWPWTCFSVALGYGIIFAKFYIRQLMNFSVFYADTLCHAVILTFDPLTFKVCGTSSVTWSKSVRNLSEVEQPPDELLTVLRIFGHVMSHCDLDLFTSWPWTFTAHRVSSV